MMRLPVAIDPSVTLLVVRLVAGGIMMFYRWDKIKNPQANARDFTDMGFKPGWLWGTLVLMTEFFGGLALLVGIFTQIAALLILIHMSTGTIWKISTKRDFGDYTYDVLVATLALVLLTYGPGPYAIESAPLWALSK